MNTIPEDILIKALELQEQGRSRDDILALFPTESGELAELLSLTDDLKAEAMRVSPSREVLRRSLQSVPVEASKHPSITTIIDRLFGGVSVFMRVLTPALAIALVFILADRVGVNAPVQEGDRTDSSEQMIIAPPANTHSVPNTTPAPASLFMKTAPIPSAGSDTSPTTLNDSSSTDSAASSTDDWPME